MKKLLTIMVTAMLSLTCLSQDLVKEIDQKQFSELVGQLVENNRWEITATRPAIIDFNADWCGPCRRLAPILKEIAGERSDIDFYSINVDNNKELARKLRISSIPMLLLVPVDGEPQSIIGLYPKEELIKTIEYVIDGKSARQEE